MMGKKYNKERFNAAMAQRLAHEIAMGPVVFQISRLMVKFGVFDKLSDAGKRGATAKEIAAGCNLSEYAAQILLESSLTVGTVLYDDQEKRYTLSKAGWFLLNDKMVRVNMEFNHFVNYKGLYHLEEALLEGRPAGLKELGDWPTIYEGLSQLAPDVQKAWFDFDHFYSDNSFDQALKIIFASEPARLLDIGGNTGKWALKCVEYSDNVAVTIMDLPQQLQMMRANIAGKRGAERIDGYPANLLDSQTLFPKEFDVVWMSQFLDCFSKEQVIAILKGAKSALKLSCDSRIYIMETLWDRQSYDTASFDLAQISVYFTAMANGNSKMFYSEDLFEYISEAGLEVAAIYDNLGYGHSLIECKLAL